MAKRKTEKPKATRKQMEAVDNILSGDYPSKSKALEAAGYTKVSAQQSSTLLETKGVQWYLKKINKTYRKRTGSTIPEAVMKIYTEGLGAHKYVGKKSLRKVDHATRKVFADQFAKFFGWMKQEEFVSTQNNQFNFFSTPQGDQNKFNDDFKKFLKQKNQRSVAE